MDAPMKVIKEESTEKKLEAIMFHLVNTNKSLASANRAFYDFLNNYPDLKEKYKEFMSEHPEINWDYNDSLNESLEEQQEERAAEKEQAQQEEQNETQAELEGKNRRRSGLRI